jgi:hypothetical protein
MSSTNGTLRKKDHFRMIRNNNKGTAENVKNNDAAKKRRKAKSGSTERSGKYALITQGPFDTQKTEKKLECSGIFSSLFIRSMRNK